MSNALMLAFLSGARAGDDDFTEILGTATSASGSTSVNDAEAAVNSEFGQRSSSGSIGIERMITDYVTPPTGARVEWAVPLGETRNLDTVGYVRAFSFKDFKEVWSDDFYGYSTETFQYYTVEALLGVRAQRRCLNVAAGIVADTTGILTASVYADVTPELLVGPFLDVGCAARVGPWQASMNARGAVIGEDANSWLEAEGRLKWHSVPFALRLGVRGYDGPDFQIDNETALRIGLDFAY